MSHDADTNPGAARYLEPSIRDSQLPIEVVALREIADAEATHLDVELQSRIDGHITVYQEVVNTMIAAHRVLADGTDIELGADTRWAAMWEMGGRCLAISNVLLH